MCCLSINPYRHICNTSYWFTVIAMVTILIFWFTVIAMNKVMLVDSTGCFIRLEKELVKPQTK